jgi:hypothetical protein
MSNKLILNKLRAIYTALNKDEDVVPSSSRTNLVLETTKQLPFKILDETSKSFPKFNATGCSLLIKFNTRVKSLILRHISRNVLLLLPIT